MGYNWICKAGKWIMDEDNESGLNDDASAEKANSSLNTLLKIVFGILCVVCVAANWPKCSKKRKEGGEKEDNFYSKYLDNELA